MKDARRVWLENLKQRLIYDFSDTIMGHLETAMNEVIDECCDHANEWTSYVEVDNAPYKPSIYIKKEMGLIE